MPAPAPAAPAPLRRFYLAIPFSPRGRPGPPGAAAELMLGDIPEPSANLSVAYDAAKVLLEWEPAGGLLGFLLDREVPMELPPFDEPVPVVACPPLLRRRHPGRAPVRASPSAPAAPPSAPAAPPGTSYNVYEDVAPDPLAQPAPASKAGSWRATPPTPLNAAPFKALALAAPLEFERERCYRVRAVRGGVESDPSPPACVRPVDVYPPPPPPAPDAVAGEGVINLIWEPSSAIDLGGYLVLRGAAGDATLQPLTPTPIFEATYRDTTVTPGRRYAYAIVAVDDRVPLGNRSDPSPRVEETAR